MRWRALILTGFLCLGGCTSVATYHNVCTESYATLAEQLSCVKANIAESGRLQDDTLVREYLQTGDILVSRVARGELSEEEAQLAFTRKLNEIRAAQLEQERAQAEINRAYRWNWPTYTDCYRSDDFLHCTTF